MSFPSVDIEGLAEVSRQLASMPDAIRGALTQKLTELGQRLEDKIKNEKLDGEVLQLGDGALRNAIIARIEGLSVVVDAPNIPYAATQEYGFEAEETVSAHSRTIKQAFGKEIAPKTIFVQTFARHMRLPERSFMRSSLDEMQDEIEEALREAVTKGLDQ